MRVAVIHPYDYYQSIPTLVALGTALTERGGRPILLYYGDPAPVPMFPWSAVHRLERVQTRGIRARLAEAGAWRQVLHALQAAQEIDALLCVDPMGLAIGAPHARRFSVPMYYFSLEMLFWSEMRTPSIFALKVLEYFYGWRVKRTIIQDRIRAEALRASWGGRRAAEFLECPNAWPGVPYREKSLKLRKVLGVPERIKIAVHAGTVSEWTMVAELAVAALTWPDDWIMVVQSRFALGDTPYELRLRAAVDTGRVRILPVALAPSELLELLSGADAGLVFYASRPGHATFGKNLELAGKSSGKFSTYLQAGLPIVCNGVGGVAPYVVRWQCGRAVEGVDSVGDALREIEKRSQEYADAARRCFNEEFATAKYLPTIVESIMGQDERHR